MASMGHGEKSLKRSFTEQHMAASFECLSVYLLYHLIQIIYLYPEARIEKDVYFSSRVIANTRTA